MITITINTDNSAFGEDAQEEALEIGRILNTLATDVTTSTIFNGHKLKDINGNTVGEVKIS